MSTANAPIALTFADAEFINGVLQAACRHLRTDPLSAADMRQHLAAMVHIAAGLLHGCDHHRYFEESPLT